MASNARSLFGLAAAAAAGGAIATVATAHDASVLAALEAQWSSAFAASPWSFAPTLAAILAGAAVSTSLAEAALRWSKPRAVAGGPLQGRGQAELVANLRKEVTRLMKGKEPDAVGACDALVEGAVKLQASDLHFSPTPERLVVTYRVQGDLVEVATLEPSALPLLATRIKVLSKLDTYVKNAPQDGRLAVPVDGKNIEARVSTLPTESGERIVLRFVRGNREVPEVGALGFSHEVETGLRELLERPQGLLFVTGPVGSGKTTTLYSALQHIAKTRGRSTTQVTLEDPIELELPFATQTQIQPKTGMTFAGTLRSVLRQDPNVLMVGEIRDRETAEIAMQAGLTGHLILTTVHGQSAAGVFARLIEMDVEPFLLSSATVGALSQRLVRMLCPICRKESSPGVALVSRFREAGVKLPDATFYESGGCDACGGMGFMGRLPIGELLRVDEKVRLTVKDRAATNEVHRAACESGMTSLIEDGVKRAARAETTLLEVLRVAG